MKYRTVVGLEVHCQLKTVSKIFCGCCNQFGLKPNQAVCPVCLGLPGALPVLNRQVVFYAIQAGLALNCSIDDEIHMSRKSYFYPDLAKAYQISQYDRPLCSQGSLSFHLGDQVCEVRLNRIHIEEDAGKLNHELSDKFSFVDYNRAGVPLIEIVSEPDISSGEEAFAYLTELKSILTYLGVSDCNMQEGSLRCDANISICPFDSDVLGTKTEVKNMNSFRGVQKAIEYEVARQIKVIESGGRVLEETRSWNPHTETTSSMRSKEKAHDYRYFPEPDLPVISLPDGMLEKARSEMPELPEQKRCRYRQKYSLPDYDIGVLTADPLVSEYFESVLYYQIPPKLVSNWMMGEFLRLWGESSFDFRDIKISPEQFSELLNLVQDKKVSQKSAKEVFEYMWLHGGQASMIVKDKGLLQIDDDDLILKIVDEAIQQDPDTVRVVLSGKEQAVGRLMGFVMKKTQGKVDPATVRELLLNRIKE